jgi:hypothetical protein
MAEVADNAVSRAEDRRRIRMPSRIRHSSSQETFKGALQGFDAFTVPELRQVAISWTR